MPSNLAPRPLSGPSIVSFPVSVRSMAIHVGPRHTIAPYRLTDVAEVRAFLAALRQDVPVNATAAAAV